MLLRSLNSPKAKLVLSLLTLVVAVRFLDQRWGPIPPIGSFMSPFSGIWAHRPASLPAGVLRLPGLKGRVEVQIDRDQIKHVFAENDHDLYFAQGYIVAIDRLWQMEFLTRLAAGRLSEVFGEKTYDLDMYFNRLGIPEAAKHSADLMLQDPVTGEPLRAYAEGVNAWIRSLEPQDYPFEYKLLGHEPELWSPQKAALLLKFMAYQLAGHSRDLALTRSRSKLNQTEFEDLFSLALLAPDPIVPRGRKWTFESRAPSPPKADFHPDLRKLDPVPTPHPANGSNNWAVMGKKSTTGRPILSNDIHLGLALPSLWYEMQLVSPSQNVYGISLPGAPGVILGFNSKLAWGVTNGGTDVLDWYELRYRDSNKSEYLFEGEWRPVISREVEIGIRGLPSKKILVRQTHFGPVVYDETESAVNPQIPKGLAMRWAPLEASNELKSFLILNRSASTAACREAIENFNTPNQNFLCADQSGDVGIWHMGRFPVRWQGQGRMILNGTSREWEWQGWIPREEVPSVRNPDRGFLSSANQTPAAEDYPHYLGWPYEKPFRGMRINEILRSQNKFSPEDLVKMQGDSLSIPARTALPHLLKAIDGIETSSNGKKLIEILKTWDFHYSTDSTAAVFFEAWFERVEALIWAPYFPDRAQYLYPPILRTLQLISGEPDARWFDHPSTPETETLNDIARAAFHETLSHVERRLGSSDLSKWTWARYRPTEFPHIAKIPGLGRPALSAPGVADAIYANTGNHGPVWKLVVAVGPKPKAWGIYPGGQSGDPTSAFYDNFLEPWSRNELKELVYLGSREDENPRLLRSVTMEGEQ
jgi:penicillin G amidase